MWCAVETGRQAMVRTSQELATVDIANEEATRRRWYVLEAECGGQVLATVPCDMVPSWVSRRRLRRALRFAAGVTSAPGADDMLSVYVVEDFGWHSGRADFDQDPEQYHAVMEITHPWVVRTRTVMPLGLSMAIVVPPFDEATKLAHWQFVGWVEGGMGGGRLLANDMWVHYEFLYRGLSFINGLRRLLGLRPLSELNLEMSESDREHMELITAVLG